MKIFFLVLSFFLIATSNSVFAQCAGSWSQISADDIGPRANAAIVYDSSRDKYILFGGSNGAQLLNTTQIFDPKTRIWTTLSLTTKPSARVYHSMIYDSLRDKVILFGGYSGQILGDTWEFDPQNLIWRRKSPASSPSPRFFHSFVYDSGRSYGVLFGGTRSTTGSYLQDNQLWEWDGQKWINRALEDTAEMPLPRTRHAMAYDSLRARNVLFGGYSYETGLFNDTWTWNGSVWAHLDTTGSIPEASQNHRMVFDSGRQKIVLTGIESPISDSLKVYELNGSNWQIRGFGGPQNRTLTQLIFDSTRARTIMFGGFSPDGTTLSDMWEWAGSEGGTSSFVQITQQVQSRIGCMGGSTNFRVEVSDPAMVQYQWRKNEEPIAGATSNELLISDLTESDEAIYDCLITSSCGSFSSVDVALTLCKADLNCDEFVDFSDYLSFLMAYDTQDLKVDFNKDGRIDFTDYLEFVSLYDQGC